MIYQRFTFLIIVRIALLLANVLVISTIFGDRRLFFNQIILAIVLIIQVAELIRFVNHTNRELSKLFYAIRHSDFSISFKQSILGKSFKDLHDSMADIIQAYKQVKIEKEAQFHLLQMMVNQLRIGIIAVEKEESITLINPTAESITGIQGLKNWKILQQLNPKLAIEIEQLGSQGRKLVEAKSSFETHYLSVDVNTLIILDKPLKLITLQNINSEIEQKEIEAWHKLIRILTHEIMNSVTPISSLTETMQSLLTDREGKETEIHTLTQETIGDIRFSLNTIQKRTDGLLNFVENYRKLTKVPKPSKVKTNVTEFLHSVERLMSHELNRKKIQLTIRSESNLEVDLDPVLIEQVLINMITNSVHALEEVRDRHIHLYAGYIDKQPFIEVTDNGKGISPKELSEIFVPFFTTKKEGSGIGLSLSKQILSAHGGSIKVKSAVNEGTTFYLYFPPQK
jgi:two-component system, NtrC family, nitrogen regulation sensor histidine kinase NtrY